MGSNATEVRGRRQVLDSIVKWTQPNPGWVKVNFDGAKLDGVAGVGVVVRDCNGVCKLVTGKWVNARSVYESELMGAWLAVSMVQDKDHAQKIVVEGDSLSVIKDIRLRGGDRFVHTLLLDLWNMSKFQDWEANHV